MLPTIAAISVTSPLYELISRLSRAVTVDEVARVSVRYGKAVAGANAGSMVVFADDRSRLEVVYSEESDGTVADATPRQTAVLTTGQAHFAPSSASLPLTVNGSSVGVLSFGFAAPLAVDQTHERLLSSIARSCVEALVRARLYDAAQRDRATAEAASRSKDDLLSLVSHELRTPLNAILGWGAMLRAGTLDPAGALRAIDAILHHAIRQARLVDDLIDASRMAGRGAMLDLQSLDVGETLRVAIEDALPIARQNGVDVVLDAGPGVFVHGDARRLEQVFLNLFANAVKFTPAGGQVRIDTAVLEGFVRVRFVDTGEGIDPALLPHVFDRFRQSEGTGARRTDGLGLGLFIARELVEAHRGTLCAESDGAGRGTTVTVALPVA